MAGIVEIGELLRSMDPKIMDGEYVFSTVSGKLLDYAHLDPLATFYEREGLTLIFDKNVAVREGIAFEGIYKQITLTVHSSLDAVGLTAAVATQLADHGISANVLAAYYHDHIFVQQEKAEDALTALRKFSV